MGPEDINLYEYRDIINKHLFAECTLSDMIKMNMHAMQDRISRQIKLYSCVVPYLLVREKCQEVEKRLINDQERREDLHEKVRELNQNVSAVVAIVDIAMMQQNMQFLTWIREFKDIGSLSVQKEIQKMTGLRNISKKNLVPLVFRQPSNSLTINIVFLEDSDWTLFF